MTWRRFLTLVRGLSPNAATVSSAMSRIQLGQKREKVNTVAGPKAAQAAFAALFGGQSANG